MEYSCRWTCQRQWEAVTGEGFEGKVWLESRQHGEAAVAVWGSPFLENCSMRALLQMLVSCCR